MTTAAKLSTAQAVGFCFDFDVSHFCDSISFQRQLVSFSQQKRYSQLLFARTGRRRPFPDFSAPPSLLFMTSKLPHNVTTRKPKPAAAESRLKSHHPDLEHGQ